MGCGCGKNKKRRQQSSRMPANKPPVKVRDILIPTDMTPNERRSTMVKINNRRKSEQRRKISDLVEQKKSGR